MYSSKTHFKSRSNAAHGAMSDAQVLEAAGDLVDAFLSLMRDLYPGHDILDADLLPSSKALIENGVRLAIVTEPRAEIRRQLVAAGKVLAQFQEGVGSRIVLTTAQAAPKMRGGVLPSQHIDRFLAAMEADCQRLSDLFEAADAAAERRFGVSIPPGFRKDGTYTWHGHQRPH